MGRGGRGESAVMRLPENRVGGPVGTEGKDGEQREGGHGWRLRMGLLMNVNVEEVVSGNG